MIHIKSKSEIEKMRASCKLASEVLYETGKRVKAGISTLEINNFAERYIKSRGARSASLHYRGFPKSICTSINDVVCHGIPSKDDILQEGDIVNIDITVIYNGFHGDTSRTFAVGKVPVRAQKLLECTERAMWAGIKAIRPDDRINEIGKAIENFLTPHNYSIVRDLTGHGIGRDFHENPSIPHFKQQDMRDRMRPGMTFTVEPMVNQGKSAVLVDKKDNWTVRTRDGSLSAQFEHTCLVTPDGYEVLTTSNHY